MEVHQPVMVRPALMWVSQSNHQRHAELGNLAAPTFRFRLELLFIHTNARTHPRPRAHTHATTAYLSENETIPCKMAIAHKSLKLGTCKGLHYHTYKISTLSSEIPLAIHMGKNHGGGVRVPLSFPKFTEGGVPHSEKDSGNREEEKKEKKGKRERWNFESCSSWMVFEMHNNGACCFGYLQKHRTSYGFR